MTDLVRTRLLSDDISDLTSGRVDPASMADAVCDRIESEDRLIHAFVDEPGRRERLRADAAGLAARWPSSVDRPPLFGIPVAVKDVIRVAGLPTRAGSALPPEVLDGPQAAVVDRLLDAGAMVAGKSVTAEFAVLAPGPTRNPHNLEHTPGGSSSGSAASVAAGMTSLALGTQTVGSMIRPAAYCGVVGFKPTYARIPADGVIPNAPSLDTVGVYAADVAGVAAAASVLCDKWRPASEETARPVLGVPIGAYLQRADEVARDAFGAQAATLADAGYQVRELDVFSDFEASVKDLFTINRYETAQVHAEWFAEHSSRYRAETVAAIKEGQAVSRAEYDAALRSREEFRARLDDAMAASGIDMWITPAATGAAPRGLATTGSSIMCLPWSYVGAPSISLPAGYAPGGLPLGLQCVARLGADELLLRWAEEVAAAVAGPR